MINKNKIIVNIPLTGEASINVDEVCKQWNNQFCISLWRNENIYKSTLVISSKSGKKTILKTQISMIDAMLIKSRLSLVEVKSGVFNSGSTLLDTRTISEHISNLEQAIQEKEFEVNTLKNVIQDYYNAM